MHRYGIFLGCSAVALLMFVIASEAQQGGGKKGGGFGFGFGGGGDNPVALLQRADVKKELEVTDDQMEKLPTALMKAVGEVLNDKQMKRFRQLDLQKKSTAAFKDEKFRKELNVTESQHKNIDEILADSAKEMKELFAEAKGGNFKGMQEKFAGLQKETKEKVFAVLTADQKKTYKQMIGEEFKFEQPKGLGGGKKDINE
jgi:hypothetical protein